MTLDINSMPYDSTQTWYFLIPNVNNIVTTMRIYELVATPRPLNLRFWTSYSDRRLKGMKRYLRKFENLQTAANMTNCEILGSVGGDYEDYGLLGYVVQSGRSSPMFRMKRAASISRVRVR
jgi:hypothetical protein